MAVALTCLVSVQSSYAATIITDSFTLTGTRTDGSLLNGVNAESGSATWNAWTNLVLDESGGNGFVTAASGSSALAKVPFHVTTGTITISAKLNPGSAPVTNPQNRYVGLGFTNANDTTTTFYSAGGQLWVQLRSDGVAAVWQGTTKLMQANAPSFTVDGFNLVSLQYDFSTKEVLVSINDTQFYSSEVSSFTPSIYTAGVELQGLEVNGTQFDAFSVSDVSVIPEPSSYALMIPGMFGLLAFAMRRVRIAR